jgi:thiol-disulfide isomerase/thioredoxin
MKTSSLLTIVTLLSSPVLQAVDAPVPAPPAEAGEFSAFKTADELWKHLQKLQEEPKVQPKSREEAMQMVGDWLGKQQKVGEAFAKTYPQDPRRWTATMLGLRAGAQMRRFAGQLPVRNEDRQKLEEVINAPDAPATVKGEAAFMVVMMHTASFDPAKPDTFTAFHTAADDYLVKYAEHPLASQVKQMQLRVLSDDPSPQSEERLKKLAAGADPRVAEAAKATLARRQQMAELKSKPVDLKFTAVDGKEVDLANMRGKVVLVDFWASWCGPCIAEMPNVVSAYSKLHDKGFEIIGISLDQDKAAMEGAMKKHQMTWTQYFDGAGWDNKISKRFGIQSIPAVWLIDKKGMLRETGLRGEALAMGVQKLLAE